MKLHKQHFSLEELVYFRQLIDHNATLQRFVEAQFKGLDILGLKLPRLECPNVVGKLNSYVKAANKEIA